MSKIQKILQIEFRRHHAFFLIVISIGIFFSGNVFAYSIIDKNVEVQRQYTNPTVPNVTKSAKASAERGRSITDLERVNPLDKHQQLLNNFSKQYGVTTGVYLQDLSTDDNIGVNESVTFESASLYKLFVAFETYMQIDAGIYSYSDSINTEAGSQTIEYCLEISITVSDNPCGRALRELVSAHAEPLPSLAEYGFVGTSLVNDYPTTSARDVGLLFEKLYRESDLSKESNDRFIEHLLNQEVQNRIPVGLPGNAEVAHKTGDLEGYSHDGGIIYTDKGTYILVVMSGPWPNGYLDAPPAISSFVSNLYQQL